MYKLNHNVVPQKNSVTWHQWKVIKWCVAYLCRCEQLMSVWNFALKFQWITERIRINCTRYFILPQHGN